MSNFRPVDRETGFLLPPSVEEWLPERHLARFVVEVIEQLDLSAFVKAYRGSGSASYHPSMLLGRATISGMTAPRVGCRSSEHNRAPAPRAQDRQSRPSASDRRADAGSTTTARSTTSDLPGPRRHGRVRRAHRSVRPSTLKSTSPCYPVCARQRRSYAMLLRACPQQAAAGRFARQYSVPFSFARHIGL